METVCRSGACTASGCAANILCSSSNREASEQCSTHLGGFVLSQKCTTACVSSARRSMEGSTLGGSLLDTHTHTHTAHSHKLRVMSLCYGSACVLFVLRQCMRCTCSCAGGQPGTTSLVSALPLMMALPYRVAGSLGPSSLQHALQGQKTKRQGFASDLSANVAFASSPSTTSNQSSGNTAQNAERDFCISCFSQRTTHSRGNIET